MSKLVFIVCVAFVFAVTHAECEGESHKETSKLHIQNCLVDLLNVYEKLNNEYDVIYKNDGSKERAEKKKEAFNYGYQALQKIIKKLFEPGLNEVDITRIYRFGYVRCNKHIARKMRQLISDIFNEIKLEELH
ncbi:uncharacterized protein [Venturia canescens]|uniref:uncharacterized protein n=1 Tax=Venturia canescens TaxID=32260 RepID=UPI001C9C5478|nr:uncharacterized protein LOC122412443 [Venturia canescens]